MAKSYITKFVEYVKNCKNQLKNNLITKGQEASDTETLDSLISKVTNINLDTTIPDSSLDYVRDPNLPDVDAMFDADPLRAVNGGEYAYCQYLVCLFPTKGSHDVKFAPYWNTSYCSRIDFSDGTSYDSSNTTSSSNVQTFTIGNSGIYTLENGAEVFIAKMYADTSHTLSMYSRDFLNYSYEAITDYKSVPVPYYNGNNYKYLKYLRLMNTNSTYVDMSADRAQSYTSDCYLVIDGDCKPFFNLSYAAFIFPNIKINGNLYNNTSNTMYIGVSGSSSSVVGFPTGNYLKIPDLTENSTVPSVNIGYQHLKGLYLPDWITSISGSNYPQFKKLHIGNGLVTPTYFTSARFFLNLTDLTLSPNAFSKNTSAVTLHFDYMVNLTNESIANLVTNLADRTGKTTNTIRLPIAIGNRMTGEQITTLQNKNWTVTFV